MAQYSYGPIQVWPHIVTALFRHGQASAKGQHYFSFSFGATRPIASARDEDQIFFKKNIATGLSGTARRRGRGTGGKNEKKRGAAVVNLAAARLHNSAIMIAL